MQTISASLPYIQIVLSLLLIAAVLLQHSGATLGGAFGGGDNWSSAFHTRRGLEKALFISTIVIAVLFTIASFLALIVR